MKIEPERFVSLCNDVVEMVNSLGDVVLGVTDGASIESIDELSVSAVEEYGEEFVFGIDAKRNEIFYTVIASPNYEYFEVYFTHNVQETLFLESVFEEDDFDSLSEEEKERRVEQNIETADVDVEGLHDTLSEYRQKPVDEINSEIHQTLANQSECTFEMTQTQLGDVAIVEVTRKLFVQDNSFSLSDVESAVVSVVNLGRQTKQLYRDLYDM